jgi:deoxyribodipyrimidine photo-lyase
VRRLLFNPTLQGQKFDPHGEYVKRWVPELAHTPEKYVHAPWTMPSGIQQRAGCVIGRDYPAPIIDHLWARRRVLQAYGVARESRRTP